MKKLSFYDVHDAYISLGVRLVENSNNFVQDKPLLSKFFKELQKEYIVEILSLEKKNMTEEEAE